MCSLPEMRPEHEPRARCPVGLHFWREQREVPLLVLHGSRKRYCRSNLKLEVHAAVIQSAPLRQVIPVHLLVAVGKLNLVSWRKPVSAPDAFALPPASQPTADQVPSV